MSYPKAHIIHVFQSIVYWQKEHVCDDFDRRVFQSVLWVVDFDCLLGDETPNENIDEKYPCGQKWPNHGTGRESEYESNLSSPICAQVMF